MSQAPSDLDPGMPLAVVLGLLAADAPRRVMGAPEDWPRWAVLLPHVLAATGHFEPLPGPQDQPGRQQDSWLLDRAATYLQVHGRLAEARALAERALAITETRPGAPARAGLPETRTRHRRARLGRCSGSLIQHSCRAWTSSAAR